MDNVDDADNDPTNEIETWGTLSGIPSDFADGVDNVDDADNDPTNEIETWGTLSGIPSDFADGVDNVDDADNDPTNEIETWGTLSGIPSDFADGVDNVDDADNDPTNEIETWGTLSGIPSDFADGVDNVDDADNDPTNEIELPAGGTNGDLLSTDGNGTYSWISNSDPTFILADDGVGNSSMVSGSPATTTGTIPVTNGLHVDSNGKIALGGVLNKNWTVIDTGKKEFHIRNNDFTNDQNGALIIKNNAVTPFVTMGVSNPSTPFINDNSAITTRLEQIYITVATENESSIRTEYHADDIYISTEVSLSNSPVDAAYGIKLSEIDNTKLGYYIKTRLQSDSPSNVPINAPLLKMANDSDPITGLGAELDFAPYALPITNGMSGQSLVIDANGDVIWGNPSGQWDFHNDEPLWGSGNGLEWTDELVLYDDSANDYRRIRPVQWQSALPTDSGASNLSIALFQNTHVAIDVASINLPNGITGQKLKVKSVKDTGTTINGTFRKGSGPLLSDLVLQDGESAELVWNGSAWDIY